MRRFVKAYERRARGITLPEVVVVLAIIAMAVAVAVPSITAAVRSARVRTAIDQFTVTLMAARMLAVTEQAPVAVTVEVGSANYYQYQDRNGRSRRSEMPYGVQIESSTNPITFEANGSVDGGSTTVIEAEIGDGVVETWTVRTSILGIATVERASSGS